MKNILFGLALSSAATNAAMASSYYCTASTDGWRNAAFDINPADLDETISGIDPLARYLYVSCMGTYVDTTRLLDCAILDDNPSNVIAAGHINDGDETLVVSADYDGRHQEVKCQRRHPPTND